jgi:hypothetical protein
VAEAVSAQMLPEATGLSLASPWAALTRAALAANARFAGGPPPFRTSVSVPRPDRGVSMTVTSRARPREGLDQVQIWGVATVSDRASARPCRVAVRGRRPLLRAATGPFLAISAIP